MSSVATPVDPLGDAAFAKYYRQKIQPQCAAIEARRRVAVARMNRRMLIATPPGLVLIALAVLGMSRWGWDWQATLLGVVVFGTGLLGFVVAPVRAYEREVKATIWPVVFAFFGPDFRYFPAGRSPAKAAGFQEAGVLPSGGTWKLGERVSGSYRGVGLCLDELKVTVRRDKKDVTVFQGLVVTLELPKALRGKTIVLRDAGRLGNLTKSLGVSLPRVKLEDPEFERAFEVYGSDQVYARVLLTPGFMERLKRLSDNFDGKAQCSFSGSKAQIFLASEHDHFEIQSAIDDPANFIKDAQAIRAEMGMIFALIEELGLHERVEL